MTEPQNSDERIEDLVFENLIRRWTEAREWEWVKGAQLMLGHIWEERERNAPETGTPENPAIGVIVEEDEPVSVPDEEDEQ